MGLFLLLGNIRRGDLIKKLEANEKSSKKGQHPGGEVAKRGVQTRGLQPGRGRGRDLRHVSPHAEAFDVAGGVLKASFIIISSYLLTISFVIII